MNLSARGRSGLKCAPDPPPAAALRWMKDISPSPSRLVISSGDSATPVPPPAVPVPSSGGLSSPSCCRRVCRSFSFSTSACAILKAFLASPSISVGSLIHLPNPSAACNADSSVPIKPERLDRSAGCQLWWGAQVLYSSTGLWLDAEAAGVLCCARAGSSAISLPPCTSESCSSAVDRRICMSAGTSSGGTLPGCCTC